MSVGGGRFFELDARDVILPLLVGESLVAVPVLLAKTVPKIDEISRARTGQWYE
jgi:hypothetical protein